MAVVVMAANMLGLFSCFLLLAGLGFGVLGLFLPWWNVDYDFQGGRLDLFVARPFDSHGQFGNDEMNTALDKQVLAAGIIILFSAFSLGGAMAVAWGRAFSGQVSAWIVQYPIIFGVLLGFAAILVAPMIWPLSLENFVLRNSPEAAAGFSPTWWGKDAASNGGGSYAYGAGAGWYLSIVGLIVLPLGALVLTAMARNPSETRSRANAKQSPGEPGE